MFYHNVCFFYLETVNLRKPYAEVVTVYVSEYGSERFECLKLFNNFQRAYISGMPNLIDISQEALQHIIERPVRIRNKSYTFHAF